MDKTYDAVKFDASWKPMDGAPGDRRAIAIVTTCERLMGAARVHVHLGVAGGMAIVTKTPAETEYFATDHARAGESRYTWELHESGCLLGTYVVGANE